MTEPVIKRRAMTFDEFATVCNYFTSDTDLNNGYGCTHPQQEDEDGCCFCWKCPLGIEADQEDLTNPDIDWTDECSEEEVGESEYIVVRCDDFASADERMAVYNYDRYMHRYDQQWLKEHPRPVFTEDKAGEEVKSVKNADTSKSTLKLFLNSMRETVRSADQQDQECLTELFVKAATDARNYVSAVCEMELERRAPTRGREKFADLDRRRSICHDSLISSVDSCNRACVRAGAPSIYTGGTERRDYGDYALQLVEALFDERV